MSAEPTKQQNMRRVALTSLAVVVGSVIFGGLPRVANVASALLPTMVIV